jgi:hypothetical protein
LWFMFFISRDSVYNTIQDTQYVSSEKAREICLNRQMVIENKKPPIKVAMRFGVLLLEEF